MVIKGLVTSQETRNFVDRFPFLICKTNEKVSLQELSFGTKGERRSQRKQVRL